MMASGAGQTMQQNSPSSSSRIKTKSVDIDNSEVADFQIPAFVNSTAVWHFGQDVYVDMALVTVEEMMNIRSSSPNDEMTVAIYNRFVMNASVFDDFAKKVDKVRDWLKTEGLVKDAS